MTKEVQGEIGLREDMVPEEVGNGVVEASKDCKEVGFEGADGTFSDVAAVDI